MKRSAALCLVVFAALLVTEVAGWHSKLSDGISLRGLQRGLLQESSPAPGYGSPSPPPSPAASPPPPSVPIHVVTTPNSSGSGKNASSKASGSGGISPTARIALIGGGTALVATLLVVAAGLYVWCNRGDQLKAPAFATAAGGPKDADPGRESHFGLLLADTTPPPDTAGGAATAARVGPARVGPPPSWRLDAPAGAGAGAAAGGGSGGGGGGILVSPSTRRAQSISSRSTDSLPYAAAASMGSQPLSSQQSGASNPPARNGDRSYTGSSTVSSAPRSSMTGSEAVPAASVQLPRLPPVPITVGHGQAGGAGSMMPGMHAHGMGGAKTSAFAASGSSDPMMAILGYGVLAACTVLAREILEAGDRVVANHARCRRIVTRIRLMQPLLQKLQKTTQGPNPPEAIDPMLQHVKEVYADCRETILKWCDKSGSWKQVVRNLVRSRAFQDEFLDLNDRLSSCYNDLTLALNINSASSPDVPAAAANIGEKEAEADLREDLMDLADELMGRGWGDLEPEEQALVKELYSQHGLDLDQLLKQAKKAWQGDKIKDLRVPWGALQIVEEVGSGGYGTVYKARWAGSEVAVKKLSATAVTERVRKELEREAYIMSTLFHPNVARFYGVVMEHPHYALVMQYYADGTLLQLLQADSLHLPWERRYALAHDIAQGMRYLHSRPVEAIVHGDLKSSNLLMDAEGRVVITDFGLAKVKTTTKTIAPGAGGVSACYCAPELLNAVTVRRTTACDVYSYGMILYEIATREMPFEGLDINLIYNHVRQGVRPEIPDTTPQAFAELTRWCWAQKPGDRPTFDQITERLFTFLHTATLD